MSYRPRKGKPYWMVNSRMEVRETFNTGSERSQKRIDVGNCFKTAQEARQFRKSIVEVIVTENDKIAFDRRIAFIDGLVTGGFIVGIVWLAVQLWT